MKILGSLLGKIYFSKKHTRKTLDQYKEELRIKEGAVQFKKLMRNGLQIPIGTL